MLKVGALQKVLKPGDLLAFRGKSIIGRTIRAWTGGTYSHVGLAWPYKGNFFILEDKEGRGVGLQVLDNLLPCDWIKTDANWTDAVDSFALAHLGQNYSYVNAIRAGLGLQPLGQNRICSEFAVAVLQMANVLPKDAKNLLTPVDVVNALLDINKPLQIITKG